MTKISAGTTLTTIVGTEVVPVFKVGQAAGDKFVMPMSLIGPNAKASLIYDGQVSYQIAPILTEDVGQAPLEFLNIGNQGFDPQGTEQRNLDPGGIYRSTGSIIMSRNTKWSQANLRWEQYSTVAGSYGSSWIEAGGEGMNLMHVPAATNPYQHPVGMGFSVRGGGSRGAETDGVVTGYVNQAFAKIFMGFETTVSGLKYWANDAADPMLWIQTKEAKGTENEMIALEANHTSNSVFGAQYFRKSRGTMESKTVVATGDITGALGWKVWDGDEYHITAIIEGVARGTPANNNVPQGVRIRTSGTNTASLISNCEFRSDANRFFNIPNLFDYTTITTIPTYTAAFPAMSTSTLAAYQQLSTSTGGILFNGFSTTSTAATAIPLGFRGILGATSPTAPSMIFIGVKNNGSSAFTDIAATEIIAQWRNNATPVIEVLGNGDMRIGTTGPTARLHVTGANNAVALLVEDDAGNDIISAGESGGARVLGFFGVTPAIRQVVATGSSTDAVITALQNLGLFAQS